MDHDQRFKNLIREFFVEFLFLFFAEWAGRLDLDQVDWLDTELFHDPPEGARHSIDMVARVGVSAGHSSLLLVHIEIEAADRTTGLKPRLPYYYHMLRDKYRLPVLPIVLYLKVGLEGIGLDTCIEELWGLELNRFQYLYVGLPGLDGIEYLHGESWLGVALSALMRIPRDQIAWLGAEALRRLAGAPLNDQQRFLLSDCVQSYLPLDETEKQRFETLLQTEPYAEVSGMNQTVYDKGMEKGIEKGIEKGRREGWQEGRQEGRREGRQEGRQEGRREGQLELILSLLEVRFGSLSPEIREHLEHRSIEELHGLAVKIVRASSLADLGLPAP